MPPKPKFSVGEKVTLPNWVGEDDPYEIVALHYDSKWKQWRYEFRGQAALAVVESELVGSK